MNPYAPRLQHFPVCSPLEAEEERREQRNQEVQRAEHEPDERRRSDPLLLHFAHRRRAPLERDVEDHHRREDDEHPERERLALVRVREDVAREVGADHDRHERQPVPLVSA